MGRKRKGEEAMKKIIMIVLALSLICGNGFAKAEREPYRVLITCLNCGDRRYEVFAYGTKIADDTRECPKCGNPDKKSTKTLLVFQPLLMFQPGGRLMS